MQWYMPEIEHARQARKKIPRIPPKLSEVYLEKGMRGLVGSVVSERPVSALAHPNLERSPFLHNLCPRLGPNLHLPQRLRKRSVFLTWAVPQLPIQQTRHL
jgi:hypothetical protein